MSCGSRFWGRVVSRVSGCTLRTLLYIKHMKGFLKEHSTRPRQPFRRPLLFGALHKAAGSVPVKERIQPIRCAGSGKQKTLLHPNFVLNLVFSILKVYTVFSLPQDSACICTHRFKYLKILLFYRRD